MTENNRRIYRGMGLIVVPHGRAKEHLPKDKPYLTGNVTKIGNKYFYVKINNQFTEAFCLSDWSSHTHSPDRSYTLYETLSDYEAAMTENVQTIPPKLKHVNLPGFYRDVTDSLCIIIGNRKISCSETPGGLTGSVDIIGTDGLFSITVDKKEFTDTEETKEWLLSQVRTAAKLL